MSTDGLTHPQHEVLQAVADYTDAHGYAPTLREIASAVGLASPSTVAYHLKRLADKGKLQRQPGLPRALVLTDSPGAGVAV